MVFQQPAFPFYFLPAVILIYFIIPGKFKNFWLLVASLFNYAWGEPVYALLLIAVILLNYFHGLLIQRLKNSGRLKTAVFGLCAPEPRRARLLNTQIS